MIERPRLLALDVGDKRIGVAVSDATGMLVSPVETVHRKNSKLDVARICKLVEQSEAAAIVVGLPKNMDGTEGEKQRKSDRLRKNSCAKQAWKCILKTNV